MKTELRECPFCGERTFVKFTPLEGYTDEVYFDANKNWQTSVRDEIYCWLDGVPELPKPPEVK